MKTAELREVAFIWLDGARTSYITPSKDVEKLIKAAIKLHYDPGVNPHNGVKTVRLRAIEVAAPELGGPYWWSTPDLQNNDDKSGARVIHWNTIRTIDLPEKDDELNAVEQAA